MNITGNIISGQVTGETSKFLSERFGKINHVKESISINRTDTSISKSSQLDFAIPQSKIAVLEYLTLKTSEKTKVYGFVYSFL